jgi:imidazolonepropionase-like amidohydrolase
MLTLINARLVDGTLAEPTAPTSVTIEGERIVAVGDAPAGGDRLDLGGRTLMPGLIDCHVHVIACLADLGANAELPNSLVAARSAVIMREMLMRGFTTVRDLGGADFGLKTAVEEGSILGPRLVICGKALSQTGGHTDYRGRNHSRNVDYYKDRLGALGRICDGPEEVRRAAREELKDGADFVKVMVNGGVSSPTDPIAALGFSDEELSIAVAEARDYGTYVAGHLYTDAGIRRAVGAGVKSVEHANLITPETARFVRDHGAFAVPTNVTFHYLAEEGAQMGLPPASVAKIEDVRGAGLEALAILREAGVMMAYGSDLLGPMHRHQSDEFVIRGRYLPADEVILSATRNAAKAIGMEGKVGAIEAGYFADLVVVDGNPLADLSLLTGQGRHMPLIMKGGQAVKQQRL